MKAIKKQAYLTILLMLLVFGVKSQTVVPPVEAHFNIETVESSNVALLPGNMDPSQISMGDTIKLSITMQLADTINISKIHIKIGTTEDGDDLFSNELLYVLKNYSGSTHTYSIDEKYITLSLGKLYNSEFFYGEIIIENNQGEFSTPGKIQIQINR